MPPGRKASTFNGNAKEGLSRGLGETCRVKQIDSGEWSRIH